MRNTTFKVFMISILTTGSMISPAFAQNSASGQNASPPITQAHTGQAITKIIVPPSAPVSGGLYVPVDSLAEQKAAPTVPAQPQTPPSAPAPANLVQPGQTYVPAPTQPTIPAPGLPPAPPAAQVPNATPGPAPIPQVGASGVPQAPPNATPIPPSDLKPAPTFVPPPGATVPVAPEDPGAPPRAGASMTMLPELGSEKSVTVPVPARKSYVGSARPPEYN